MVNIDIEGHKNFPCPVDRTVEEAENKIRSMYGLLNGGILKNGVAMFLNDIITAEADGVYQFVNFQPQQVANQGLQVVSLSDASVDAIVHGVLNHVQASPVSLTPATIVVKDAPHYMRMCERVVNHVYNKRNLVENYYLMDYKDGELFVHRGMSTDALFRLVIPSAVAASNVYHLLKALNDKVPKWIDYLARFGIPQLVEMVNTGSTPKYDGTGYHPDGLESLE